MVGPEFAQGSQFTKIKHRKVLKLIMAGASFQIQIRHIQVAKKDVADLLVETVGATKAGVSQVQLLMKLAGKYSNCRSKEDGGNLGWVEMGWGVLGRWGGRTSPSSLHILRIGPRYRTSTPYPATRFNRRRPRKTASSLQITTLHLH